MPFSDSGCLFLLFDYTFFPPLEIAYFYVYSLDLSFEVLFEMELDME